MGEYGEVTVVNGRMGAFNSPAGGQVEFDPCTLALIPAATYDANRVSNVPGRRERAERLRDDRIFIGIECHQEGISCEGSGHG